MLTLIHGGRSEEAEGVNVDDGRAPILGALYMVIDAPACEYLTIGTVYECSHVGTDVIGLHRPNNGGGTYINVRSLASGRVVIAPARAS